MRKNTKFIMSFAAPHKWKFAMMQFCMIVTTITLVILPYIIGWLIDEVIYSRDMSRFIYIVCIYGGVYTINQVMFTIQNILEKVLSTAFLFDIRAELYSRILRFKGKYLSNLYTGDIISRLGADVDQISTLYMNLFGLVADFLNLFIAFGFIFAANVWLGVFSVVITPVVVYISRYFWGRAKEINFSLIKKKGLLSSWIFEILGSMQEIKLLHASRQIIAEFLKRGVEVFRLQIDLNRVEVIAERINGAISLAAQMLLFCSAAFLVRDHQLTIGSATACFSYFSSCIYVFNAINSKILAFSSNLVACGRIRELFDAELEDAGAETDVRKAEGTGAKADVREQPEKESASKLAGSIEFRNVSFHYREGQPIFRNLSFQAAPCEKVAIVGHSGAGKSTLMNLLCRIYDPAAGEILIDGRDIQSYDLKYLRSQIGIVHQNSIVFQGTIRFNLQFDDDPSRDGLLWEALKMAGIDSFVKSLEKGLDTVIGRENSFSGGQKQRITIARAFVKNPPIMVFDESTSSLDSESELTIQNAWEILGQNHTLLIIAHRLSTIINADRILVIEDGRVVGAGKHEELLRTCASYSRLFEDQCMNESA